MSEPKNMITIKMTSEKATDKAGKEVKDDKGDVIFQRDDYWGLIGLLNRFNSTLHGKDSYKSFLKIKDTLRDGWKADKKEIELALDESSFLKQYLTDITEKDAKGVPLKEFELRTLLGVLEQLN